MKKILISIICIVSLSACEKEQNIAPSNPSSQHPRFSLQLPTCNWDSGVMTHVEISTCDKGTLYRYEKLPDFLAMVTVRNGSIQEITGIVGVYTYYVDQQTRMMHLCSNAGSYPVTYSLIY
jgi:hypothetical protein